MQPIPDLTSFLTFIPQSRLWEAYVQGRRAIHVEYSNFGSEEPELKLTPINKWGARITAFDRKERFIIEGNLDSKTQDLHGKSLVATLPCDSPPPKKVYTVKEELRPKIAPDSISSEGLWERILVSLGWIIERLREEHYQIKIWCGSEFRAYYNSLGSVMTSLFPLSKLKISIRLTEGVFIKRAGAREGVEFFEEPLRRPMEDFLQEVQQARVARKEKPIPEVLILDPEAMAMFIHEAIGHSSEGDNVLADNSWLKSLSGQKIAPSNVTIVDSPKDFSSLAVTRLMTKGF